MYAISDPYYSCVRRDIESFMNEAAWRKRWINVVRTLNLSNEVSAMRDSNERDSILRYDYSLASFRRGATGFGILDPR